MHRLFVVALVVASACGKDEPAPPPAPTAPTVATTPTPTAPPAPTEAEDRQTDPAVAKPAGTPDPTTPAALPLASATAMPEAKAIAGTTVATFHPSILAVGGTTSLDGLVAAFGAQAQRAPGIPSEVIEMAAGRIKATFGLEGATWFAADKPLRFAVPDPKVWPDGFVLLLPTAAGTKLEVAMIPSAVAKGEGHWAKLERDGRAFYLDVVADVLVVTSHADLFKKLGDFPQTLAAWTPTDVLVLETSVANARTIYTTELAQAEGMTKAMGEQLREAGMASEQLEAIQSIWTGTFGIVKGLDKASIALDMAGAFPRVQLGFTATPGSPLAATLADLEQRRPSLAASIPDDAWFAVAYDMDLSGMMGGSDALLAALSQPDAPWTTEQAKTMVGFITKLQELSTGPSAFWVRTEGAFPLALESVAAVSDAAAAKASFLGLLDLVFSASWTKTRAQLAEGGMPADSLPAADFRGFVRDVGQISRAFGVALDLPVTPGADTLALNLEWSRLGAGRIPATLHGWLSKAIGPRLEMAIAGDAGRYALTVGPEAASRAAGLTAPGAAESPDAWIARAAKESFTLMAFRPTRLLRALSDLPQLANKREAIVKLPDDPFMVEGKSTGGRLLITLTVPAELFVGLMNLR